MIAGCWCFHSDACSAAYSMNPRIRNRVLNPNAWVRLWRCRDVDIYAQETSLEHNGILGELIDDGSMYCSVATPDFFRMRWSKKNIQLDCAVLGHATHEYHSFQSKIFSRYQLQATMTRHQGSCWRLNTAQAHK